MQTTTATQVARCEKLPAGRCKGDGRDTSAMCGFCKKEVEAHKGDHYVTREGSPMCRNRAALAAGGTRTYCTCAACF